MNEHIELLMKELRALDLNLYRAQKRPGVKPEEIDNIKRKIRLKSDLLKMVEEKE